MSTTKLTLELKQYQIFQKKFKEGLFGTQRYGQAFYDYFKLDKLTDQIQLHNLYAKDGEHAKRSIESIFEFN